MQRKMKRILSMFLVMVTLLGVAPVPAFAATGSKLVPYSYCDTSNGWITARHGDNANITWVDGHVTSDNYIHTLTGKERKKYFYTSKSTLTVSGI